MNHQDCCTCYVKPNGPILSQAIFDIYSKIVVFESITLNTRWYECCYSQGLNIHILGKAFIISDYANQILEIEDSAVLSSQHMILYSAHEWDWQQDLPNVNIYIKQ